MRLTLRNLLAYLHEVMSPDDRAKFAPLVSSGARVQQLLERCKTVGKSPTLPAPALDQAHERHAADTVGRYLDFQLPDAELAPFERAALDSDEQLAEIVDCHRMLSDIVSNKVIEQSPTWKPRLYALLTQQPPAAKAPAVTASKLAVSAVSAADDDEYALAPVADEAAVTALKDVPAVEAGADRAEDPAIDDQRAIAESRMEDSGDLSQLLDDDDEELSEEAARAREKKIQQEVVAEQFASVTSGGGGSSPVSTAVAATKLTNYGVRDPYKDRTAPAPVPITMQEPKFELAVPLPMLIGGGVGAVAVLALIVMLGMWMFSGPSKPRSTGPFVYGIAEGENTVEMNGFVSYAIGGSPTPDAGAIIAVWPVDAEPVTKLTAVNVMEGLNNKQQNPYNEQLVVAKTDERGQFRLRMHKHDAYHVMVISQGMLSDIAKTWTDEINSMKTQVEDPASLVGQRVYYYTKITTPPDGVISLDHYFETNQ